MKQKAIIPEELLDTFRIASEQELTIALPDAAAANTLRFKFHHARKRMRIDGHPLLEKAERVVFQLKENILIAGPYTAKFGTALEDALKPHAKALAKEKAEEFAQEADALVSEARVAEQEKLARRAEEQAWLDEEAERLTKVQAKKQSVRQKSVREMLDGSDGKSQ